MHVAELAPLQVATENAWQTAVLEAPPAPVVAFHDAIISRDGGASSSAIHDAGELVALAEPGQCEVALRLDRVRKNTLGLLVIFAAGL